MKIYFCQSCKEAIPFATKKTKQCAECQRRTTTVWRTLVLLFMLLATGGIYVYRDALRSFVSTAGKKFAEHNTAISGLEYRATRLESAQEALLSRLAAVEQMAPVYTELLAGLRIQVGQEIETVRKYLEVLKHNSAADSTAIALRIQMLESSLDDAIRRIAILEPHAAETIRDSVVRPSVLISVLVDQIMMTSNGPVTTPMWAEAGSGTIVGRQGDKYLVLTAHHVTEDVVEHEVRVSYYSNDNDFRPTVHYPAVRLQKKLYIKDNGPRDWALLEITSQVPLAVAKCAPKGVQLVYGQPLWMNGISPSMRPCLWPARVAAPVIDYNSSKALLVAGHGAPGQSGSATFNDNMELVAINQFGYSMGFSMVSTCIGATMLDDLKGCRATIEKWLS